MKLPTFLASLQGTELRQLVMAVLYGEMGRIMILNLGKIPTPLQLAQREESVLFLKLIPPMAVL